MIRIVFLVFVSRSFMEFVASNSTSVRDTSGAFVETGIGWRFAYSRKSLTAATSAANSLWTNPMDFRWSAWISERYRMLSRYCSSKNA